jgi:protein TonB
MKLKKSRGANLERLRISFFLMGLCFSGAIVLSAFEWRTPLNDVRSLEGSIEYELPPEAVNPFIPKDELKPRPDNQQAVIDVLQIVEEIEGSEEGKNDDPGLDLSVDPDIEQIGFLPEEKDEEELPVPESTVPQFPGGMSALSDFLQANLKYPSRARANGVKGTVWVTFLVDKNGNVSNIQTVRGIGMGCDEEAMRVVSLMPQWIPGKQRGIPVDVLYKLPVRFDLR